MTRLHAFLQELNIESVPIAHEHVFWLEVLEWLAKYADHGPTGRMGASRC